MLNDPYSWPGLDVLKNKLKIRDAAKLAAAESRIVVAQDFALAQTTLPGVYDFAHFKEFHARLFGDVYEWAGKTRTVAISKPGAMFCAPMYIDDEMTNVLSGLPAEDYLLGLRMAAFVERFACYYGEINARHPFREGNGRTQRAFLRQLAAAAGWAVDWSLLGRDANIDACRVSLNTARTDILIAVLTPLVTKLP